MVTATKVIGEHSHPHSAGWEGSLIGGMKMETLYSAPSSSCIRKDAPKWQATPTESSPVQEGVEGGFYLNWLVRGCFLAKSDLPDGFFTSTNLEGGEKYWNHISSRAALPGRPIFWYSSNQVGGS